MTRLEPLRIALLGPPNTGKSTLFNRLTGGHARIANWPGLTVDLLRGDLVGGAPGERLELIDLPGIHGFGGESEDQAIVQRFLAATPPDLVVVVLNATQAATQLRLFLETLSLGLPTLLALNMSDEARRLGVRIDAGRLAAGTAVPVLPVSARSGEGIPALLAAIRTAATRCPEHRPAKGAEARLQELVATCVHLPEQACDPRARALDRVLLHPLVGPALFLAIVLALFQAVYALALPLQDALARLFEGVRAEVLVPGLTAAGLPALLRSFLLDGLWLGITTVSSFLPLIFLFYLMFAVVEDSGYLPRAAFLMDGLMQALGLDGRAFVLQLMGLGCNVPAILGTRVIRDPAMRLLAMLVIPFSLCQARLTVFVFLAGVFFPRPWWAAALVLFGFYLLSFAAAILTALIFRRALPGEEPFVLELPPYRSPSLRTMVGRAWRETVSFTVATRGFIVLGAAAIWLLTHLPPGSAAGAVPSLADAVGRFLQPLLGPIGMNPALTVSLFFGFIAKEILLGAMAVIHHTGQAGLGAALRSTITPLQALGFMTFTLLYTPCLSTVAAQRRESRNLLFPLLSVGWSLTLAWTLALVVVQGGLLLQRAFPAA
ncbi:MAG: ferrous iron transport protein B [Synechococcaceae cyanobacterium]|nr:ferrous iron transport protein B [Synechococcaceae cyanobacterium]